MVAPMKTTLRWMAVAVAVAAIAGWAIGGAHRGWTRTSVAQRTLDDVTGLEAVTYEKRFVPGLDFLGAGLLGAVVLAGSSLLGRRPSA
jgi:hypothetical protein